MANYQPKLTIIIVNWNTCELLLNCLDSIDASSKENLEITYEIIVVDNGSHDGSAKKIREAYPSIVLIENKENFGFARANNQAYQRSRSDLILLLNSDTLVPAHTVKAMCDFMNKNHKIGAIGVKLLNPDGSFQASYANFPSLWSELVSATGLSKIIIGPYAPSPRPKRQEKAYPVDWVSGAALLIRREIVNRIGLFDERYFMYGEETDLRWRIWKSGSSVWYVPDITIIHFGGSSTRLNSIQSYIWLYQSKVNFFKWNYGQATAKRFCTILRIIASSKLKVYRILLVLGLKNYKGSKLDQRILLEKSLLETITTEF